MFKQNIAKVSVLLLTAGLFTQPAHANDWGWRSHYYHPWQHPYYVRPHYPRFGRVVFDLPFRAVTIVFGGSRYHYCDGVFYRRHYDEYVIVAPPVGAVIETLPSGCEHVIINGAGYYSRDGVYYRPVFDGYKVVSDPSIRAVTEIAKSPETSFGNTEDSFTINIPDSRGGYTAVTLKKSGDGYIGPQGEFYNEFPSVEQLKAMYAK